MDEAAFEAQVRRMEQMAAERPAAYRRRVFALAGLGYGFLLLTVVSLVAVVIALGLLVAYLKWLGVKLIVVALGLLAAVGRSMWVRIEAPKQRVVTRAQAPALFAMLDRLRARLDTPAVHEVQVTGDFNAGVTQVPRFGLFGGHRNYLIIGLPLMKGLTPQQFEAVLAHELGHLSRGHARAGNWIYRLRLIWARLEAELGRKPHWGSGAVRAFYRWYVPYFNAASFPLARANEYEADAASAELTSARTAAQALTAVSVVERFLSERYWPQVHAQAKDSAQPTLAPLQSFGPQAVQAVPETDRSAWLDAALARATSSADTHPALKDRLRALGVGPELVLPQPGQGADQLLGSELAPITEELDRQWSQAIGPSWRDFHERTQRNRERLAELRDMTARAPLGESDALEHARLEGAVGGGAEVALALLRELIARLPESPAVAFALGAQLLERGDEAGIAPMEFAIEHANDAIAPGAERLRDFYARRGEVALAQRWHQRHVARVGELTQAEAERRDLKLTDRGLPHDLPGPALAQLRAALAEIKPLRRCYLIRKAVRHLPEHPYYVVGFTTVAWYGLANDARRKQAMELLRTRVEWPGRTLIVPLEGRNSRFTKIFRRVEGSRVR